MKKTSSKATDTIILFSIYGLYTCFAGGLFIEFTRIVVL